MWWVTVVIDTHVIDTQSLTRLQSRVALTVKGAEVDLRNWGKQAARARHGLVCGAGVECGTDDGTPSVRAVGRFA